MARGVNQNDGMVTALEPIFLRAFATVHFGQSILSKSPAVGATSVVVSHLPLGAIPNAMWIAIDPYTSECEMRKVTNISGNYSTGYTLTVAALAYAHSANNGLIFLDEPRALIEYFGGGPGLAAATNTTAFTRAVAQIAGLGGGRLVFAAGTYNGKFVLGPHASTIRFIIEGAGSSITILKSDDDIVLDVAANWGTEIRDLQVYADTGSDVGIFMGRYTELAGNNASETHMSDVRVTSYASVAGVLNMGSDLSCFDNCHFDGLVDHPIVICAFTNVLGAANAAYTSPNGTIQEGNGGTTFRNCRFLNTVGDCLEIGAETNRVKVMESYFNCPTDNGCIVFDPHGEISTNSAIYIHDCNFEWDGSVSPILGRRTGGAGTMQLLEPEFSGLLFAADRDAGGYHAIDLSNVAFTLRNPQIHTIADGCGGGLALYHVRSGVIEWQCTRDTIGVNITALDADFTATAGHRIEIGDYIVVGNAVNVDADAYSEPERKLVTNVVGDVITTDTAFVYDHAAGGNVYVGLPQIDTVYGVTVICEGQPELQHDYGIHFIQRGYLLNQRMYFGAQLPNTSPKSSYYPVLRPAYDVPSAAEEGLLTVMRSSAQWSTETDMDGWTQIDNPAVYSDGEWYGIPLGRRGNVTGYNPPDLAAGASDTPQDISVPDAAMGDLVVVASSIDLDGCAVTGYVSAAGNVKAILTNHNAGNKNLGSMALRALVIKH